MEIFIKAIKKKESGIDMSYRNLIVTRAISISIRNNQLVLGNEDMIVPLEDVNCLVLEHAGIRISSGVLQRLSDADCVVYICDEKHLPATVVLPIAKHSRHYKMLIEQMDMSKPNQNRLWQQIVKRKIQNQAKCLELCDRDNAEQIYNMVKQVQSGDKTNVEAQAAALYFKSLFGNGFTRGDENGINAALNYGYSIIRGQIARSIVSYGFEPSMGIHHHSQLNNFNLADDFIEPFRPLVDYFVVSQLHVTMEHELQKEDRYQLVDIVNYDMKYQGQKHVVHHMIDKMIASFNSYILGNKTELELPELIMLSRHSYE